LQYLDLLFFYLNEFLLVYLSIYTTSDDKAEIPVFALKRIYIQIPASPPIIWGSNLSIVTYNIITMAK
jgi:hypothetical protein